MALSFIFRYSQSPDNIIILENLMEKSGSVECLNAPNGDDERSEIISERIS